MTRIVHRSALLIAVLVGITAGADGWVEATPDGTTCWDGRPWKFWYRPGPGDDVAIWFQGGGGCWRADMCDANGEPTFDGRVDHDDHPARSAGLFDERRIDNPLRGWRILFVPYCTGDVHIGRATVDYTRNDGSTFRVAHQGSRNVRAALDWLASRLVAEGRPPLRIFVSGESAGAIAASYWAYEIGDRWPDADLAVVGDAAGGYRSAGVSAPLERWGVLDALPRDVPAYADRSKVYFETFYIAAAQRHPAARLGQVNFADDAVQRRFMGLLGTPTDILTKGLTCNLNEIRIDSPNFHSYIYPGSAHAMLRTPAVYETACEGERLVDWVRGVIEGRPVQNRWCDGTAGAFADTNVPRL